MTRFGMMKGMREPVGRKCEMCQLEKDWCGGMN